MHRTTLAFVTLAALVMGTSSAYALDVKKKITAPGVPPKVWAIVSDFCSIKDWHPVVADCQETKEGDATFRTLTLKDGGKIKEKLLESDDTSYSYEIIESPLPVKNYKAKLSVEPDDRSSDHSTIVWEATFDANGKSDEEAAKTIGDIFFAGLKSIKHKAQPPEGGNAGDEDKN
ncbi:SRPBCC family protein [Methyloceanibacter sp.]|uniref:SRPBCC family protein n=1 Tax=Methyloceanibacter sp. TaxID=1965321 RepID=UPI003D6CB84F